MSGAKIIRGLEEAVDMVRSDPFHDLPGLRKAFTTPILADGKTPPDYVIIDRLAPRWQVNEIDKAVDRGLIEGEMTDVEGECGQLRFELTDKGREALLQA